MKLVLVDLDVDLDERHVQVVLFGHFGVERVVELLQVVSTMDVMPSSMLRSRSRCTQSRCIPSTRSPRGWRPPS